MAPRLLIITQAVDTSDHVLGFFHGWIEEFAKRSPQVTVLCLKEGQHALPGNVHVHSLGKERGVSKLRYLINFYIAIRRLRREYDAVFVHMNQEYVLLGGLFWRFMGKRIGLWRNHAQGTFLTRIAVMLAHRVFCTSPRSYTAQFAKTKVMPVGIDTALYQSAAVRAGNSILFFGRLSPVKNVHVFIEALTFLDQQGVDFHADIIGSPANPSDVSYEQSLHKTGQGLVQKGKLSFKSAVSHAETASLYSTYGLYANLTPDGSMDKTILEAMAAGTPVLVGNSAFRGHIPQSFELQSLEAGAVATGLESLLSLSGEKRRDLGTEFRTYVKNEHSLEHLVTLLMQDLTNVS